VIEAAGVPDPVRRQLIAGVNYLFKSLDLIPDGIDDIGYLDDAFVLRVAADLVKDGDLGKTAEDKVRSLKVLAGEADLVREFLEASTYDRLVRYTKDLVKGSARGRSVDDIATSPDVFREFASEVRSFSSGYESPSFSREEKNLIKLRAFFEAKLPR
jgi:uncharacterized membrane protein YkvA (DUF1232 family)